MSNLTGSDRYMRNRVSEFKTAVAEYFKYLHLMGQTINCDPYRMIMSMHINEIFTGKFASFVTADDYRVMDKVLRNITGEGLMPYHVWRTQMAPVFSATDKRKPVYYILEDFVSGAPLSESDVDTLNRVFKDIPDDYNDFIIEAGTARTVL